MSFARRSSSKRIGRALLGLAKGHFEALMRPRGDTSETFMAKRGRTIRLFLVNGNPAGLTTAEVGGWTGKVMVVPRTALAAFLRRPEAQRVALPA
jgi:hypothetical protein